jgi:hypothetical protein
MFTLKNMSLDSQRRLLAISITTVICALLALWAIYGIRDYGLAIFIFTPFFLGSASAFIYGFRRDVTWIDSWRTSYLALAVFAFGLMLCAIEGLICIVMAAPFGILFTWIGSGLTYALMNRSPKSAPIAVLVAFLSIPFVGFVENDSAPTLASVVTSVEINATPEQVWKNVVEFPELDQPEDLLFRAGIAYPINAEIAGQGTGAVRYCNFSTGSFVEPITTWDQPRLLAFTVEQQPPTMKELSFWDIDAPHLNDYFVSKHGQFRLIALPNGRTRLEGTTWYSNDIRPAFYWELWSDYIIHKIHNRVLEHIKKVSEGR